MSICCVLVELRGFERGYVKETTPGPEDGDDSSGCPKSPRSEPQVKLHRAGWDGVSWWMGASNKNQLQGGLTQEQT